MNFIDILTVIFFLANIGVFLAKLYNLMSNVQVMAQRGIVMSMVVSLLSWLMIMVAMMSTVGDALIALTTSIYLQVTSFLMVLNFMLSIAESFLLYAKISQQAVTTRQRKPGRMP